MANLFDPILLILLGVTGVCLFLALPPGRRPMFWLLTLTVLLFALPRAGGVLDSVNLPLPLASLLAAGVTLKWLFTHRAPGRPKLGEVLVMIYTAIAGIGLAIGLSTGGNYLVAFVELCIYLFSIGLYFYARETFNRPEHFRIFFKALLIISVLVSLYGIAQQLFGSTLLIRYVTYNSATDLARGYVEVDNNIRRVLSSYGDPNVLAGQLMIFCGMGLALLIGRQVSLGLRLLAGVILALNIICTYCTGSRAALAGLVVVGLVVAVWRSRWSLLLVAVAVMAGLYFLPDIMASEMVRSTRGVISPDDIRYQFPKLALQLLQAAPLGCGLGNTLQPHFSGTSWTFESVPAVNMWHGFNSFWLNLLSRVGVLGVAAFLAIIVWTFRDVWRQSRRVADPQARSVIIGALAGFLAQWLIWLVNNTYMLPGGNLNFWFTLGMLVAGVRAYSAQAQPVLIAVPVSPATMARLNPAYYVAPPSAGSQVAPVRRAAKVGCP